MSKTKQIFINISIITLTALFIVYTDISVKSAREAIDRCLNILIPSLFAFMALAGLMIRSGAYKIISIPFYPIARYIFKVPYELFSVILISNIAGFPIGASMLNELVDSGRIDKKTASIMQCFCYGGGPSFSVGVIGLSLFGSKRIGYIICISSFFANMIMALILCRMFKLKISEPKTERSFNSEDLMNCTQKAGASMLTICALIILFCVSLSCAEEVITRALYRNELEITPQGTALIKTVFELSSISELNVVKYSFIPLIASLFSFGGVCILLQISIVVNNKYSLIPFFITRLPVALISYCISMLLCSRLVDTSKECFTYHDNFMVNFNNFIPSICLILMIFLLLFKKGVAFFKEI